MAKPFIKKLSVIPLEGDVQNIDYTPEPEITHTPRKLGIPKSLERFGKLLIVMVSTFLIIYGPIFTKNHVNIKLLEPSNNNPLILDWLVWLGVIVICFFLLSLSIMIVYLIFRELIIPLYKWIIE